MLYIYDMKTRFCIVPKAKPPVIEIEKWYGTTKPEGEAHAGIESLSLCCSN